MSATMAPRSLPPQPHGPRRRLPSGAALVSPAAYGMCLNCGQELWADSLTATVLDCFACRPPPQQGGGGSRPPQASGSDHVFLRQLRTSRAHARHSASLGDSSAAADRTACRASMLARQAQSYDPQAAVANSRKHKVEERRKKLNEIHFSRGIVDGTARSQSTPCLLEVKHPVPKPSPPTPTGNHMLDSVLGKLNKPKLQEALDCMVRELQTNRKSLSVALSELDINGDGILSRAEMAVGLRRMGVTLVPSELDAVMRAFDFDQRGTVQVDGLAEILTTYQSHFMSGQSSGNDSFDAEGQTRGQRKSHRVVIEHPGIIG